MSSQKGNVKKKSQKYQNSHAFKNDLHDSSRKTKALNEFSPGGVCARCEQQIKWKIQYKKYKPLTQPKKCTKCEQRTITQAYHTVCKSCATTSQVCAKCSKNSETLTEHSLSPREEASQASHFEADLRHLPERQRRSLLRSMAKGDQEATVAAKELGKTGKTDELDGESGTESDEQSEDGH